MAFCTQCGAYVEDGDTFCTSCGSRIVGLSDETVAFNPQPDSLADDTMVYGAPVAAAPFQEPAPAQQPYGGAPQQMPYNAAYDQQPQYPSDAPMPPSKGKKSIVPVLIAILAAVVVIGGVCVWGFGLRGFDRFFNHDDAVVETVESGSGNAGLATGTSGNGIETNGTSASASGGSTTTTTTPSVPVSSNRYINANPVDDYVFSWSSNAYITESDLNSLTEDQLRIARNEIAARHGRAFNDPELREYFESKSWYHQTVSAEAYDANTGAYLNDVEMANSTFIREYENRHGYNQ